MPGSRRTAAEIRLEMAAEREQLEEALADLRAGIDAKRRPARAVVGLLAAGLAAALTAKAVRRFRD